MHLYTLALLLFASTGQSLELIYSNTKLPSPTYGHSIAFDGVDSVYLIGGSSSRNQIVKYSLDDDTVQVVGSFVSVRGNAVWTGNNTIYHFHLPSLSFSAQIWKIDAANMSKQSLVGSSPTWGLDISCSVWDGRETVYLFGGQTWASSSNKILKFSTRSETVEQISQLPGARYGASAVWTGDFVYIFGGANNVYLKDILKFDTSTGLIENVASLPIASNLATAIWTGKEAYIIGGIGNGLVPKLVRFNPELNEVVEIPVNNFVDKLYDSTSVFVERKNRIYMFGGWNGAKVLDAIMYIELGPPIITPTTAEPTTTTAPTTELTTTEPTITITTAPTTEPTTTEPTITTTTAPTTEPTTPTCPTAETSLPVTTAEPPECTFPSNAPVEPTTYEYEDGTSTQTLLCLPGQYYQLPVPGNCTAYIICAFGNMIIEVCKEGLKFDPILLRCELEELVDCFDSPEPTTKTPTTTTETPICPEPGFYKKPYSGSCRLYYVCAEHTPVILDCGLGLVFDENLLDCVRQENSNCTVTTTSTPGHETTTKLPAQCDPDRNHYISYDTDTTCRQYFHCYYGVPILLLCSQGTLFDPVVEKCVREEDYDCPFGLQ